MKVDDRAAALVALVESDRDARRHAIVEPAARESRAELAAARRDAKLRVGTAIAEERAAFSARVAAAEARLATARRMVRQRRLAGLVAEGWQRLPAALAARWSDPAARGAWIEAALARAVAVLPAGNWRIAGPASWSAAERDQARAWLAARGIAAQAEASDDIDAGIQVTSGKVELDATPAGLTAGRADVEGRLLYFFEGP